MCSICRQTPCHPRCPNAPEPVPVHTCVLCDEGIYEGDEYYDSGDGPVCKECMEDKTTAELMEMFGESYSTAHID